MSVRTEPFTIDVPQDVLDDLRLRLERARPAGEVAGAGWDYGTNGHYLADLVEHWRDRFDWRAAEARLNALANLRADVDGLGVHVVAERGRGPAPLPIVLIHGWPSGYLEMTRLIPLLADPGAHGGDPADAFDVVVPSLPGFGFSDPPRERGFGYARMAEILARLVTDGLGHGRYGLHVTGLGAYVGGRMALADPDAVVGLHTHDPVLLPPVSFDPLFRPATAAEARFLERSREWGAAEGAYGTLHRTKPSTLAHALNDSPMGLLSWLLDKHRTWSDCDGDIERRYGRDDLLTAATLYWVTGSIGSSVRVYYERVRSDPAIVPGTRLPVPTGVAMPPERPGSPPRQAPREMVERTHDVRHWAELPAGGHFASWEEPEAVAASIRAFFRPLR